MTERDGPKRPSFGVGLGATLAVLAVLMPGCDAGPAVTAAPEVEPKTAPDDEAAPPSVPYKVEIQGIEDRALRELLQEVSETRRLIDRPPPSLTRLRRRAEDDRARLQRALRSRGYYGATIDLAIDAAAKPVHIVFQVDPGPQYRLRDVAIEVTPPEADLPLPSLDRNSGSRPGSRLSHRPSSDAETALVERARARGYALAEAGERRAVVDHDADAMDLTLHLVAGSLVRFGAINVVGLTRGRPGFVERRLPWRQGELITVGELGRRTAGVAGNRAVLHDPNPIGDHAGRQGRLPVTVAVSESKHRSIEVGGRYRTDEGPGGNVAWEHRNFFGRGERVRLELDASPIAGFLIGSFRKPDVLDTRSGPADRRPSWRSRIRTPMTADRQPPGLASSGAFAKA